MNQTFNLQRLLKLIRKHGIENGRAHMMSMLAMFGCQAIFMTFWATAMGPVYQEVFLYIFYACGLIIAGSVFSSMAFSFLGDKPKGIYWLSVPASHLEKLITVIFYYTILFFLLYTAGFLLFRMIAVSYIKGHSGYTFIPLVRSQGFGSALPDFLFGYLSFQAFYMMGSVYFAKLPFIKTTLTGVVVIVGFIIFNKLLTDSLGEGFVWNFPNILDLRGSVAGNFKVYSLSPMSNEIVSWTHRLIWAPLFLVTTWFRLKEKQI